MNKPNRRAADRRAKPTSLPTPAPHAGTTVDRLKLTVALVGLVTAAVNAARELCKWLLGF